MPSDQTPVATAGKDTRHKEGSLRGKHAPVQPHKLTDFFSKSSEGRNQYGTDTLSAAASDIQPHSFTDKETQGDQSPLKIFLTCNHLRRTLTRDQPPHHCNPHSPGHMLIKKRNLPPALTPLS